MTFGTMREARRAIRRAAAYFGVDHRHVTGTMRHQRVVRARSVAAWCGRKLGLSYPELGRLFNRHHTTMLRHVQRGEELVKELG